MNSKPLYFVLSVLMTTSSMLLVPGQVALAEQVDASHWVVKSGDSLYSIARKIFPGNAKKQARLRREILKLNSDVFNGNANLMSVGDRLTLPDFARQKTDKVRSTPAPTQIVSIPAVKPMPTPQAVKAPAKKQPAPAVAGEDPQQAIGRVLVYMGDVKATNRGSTRTLGRDSKVYKGDTLKTADRTFTQIRMKDGALIALRPDTEIRLEEYNYNGAQDGTERSILDLVRGGFRTITGAIGHKNKQNYQVRTTIATIGIRGTHYGLMLCQSGSCQNDPAAGNLQDGLYGGVVDGEIVTENGSGVHVFSNDEYFHIAGAQTLPKPTLAPPPIFQDPALPAQPMETAMNNGEVNELPSEFRPREQGEGRPLRDRSLAYIPLLRESDRLALVRPELNQDNQYEAPLPPKAPDGSGMAVAFSHIDQQGQRTGAGAPIYITALNSNNIFLEQLQLPNGNVVNNLPFAVFEQNIQTDGTLQTHEAVRLRPDGTGAAFADLGGNGTLGVNWGRWVGNFVMREDGLALVHDQDLHFMYSDNLTPLTNLMNLGGLRTRIALYQYAGGTLPTDTNGQVALTNPSIFADVDFVNHQLVGYSVDADVGGQNWYGSLTGGPVDFTDLNQSFRIGGACHGQLCDGEASMLFVGSGAGGAMTSYSLVDGAGDAINGTALLTPNTLATLPDNSGILYGFHGGTVVEAYPVLINANSVDNAYVAGGNVAITEDRFTDQQGNDHFRRLMIPSSAILSDTGTNGSIPATQINWGRWDSAEFVKDTGSTNVTTVAFIESDNLTTPAQLGGLNGTATYSMVAGSFNGYINGTADDGTSTVSMDVNFDLAQVTNYSVAINQSVTNLDGQASNIPFQALSSGFPISGSTCPSCTGTAAVSFVGDAAEGAITSASISDGTNVGTGTAIMTRP
jgi:hypothetical protein